MRETDATLAVQANLWEMHRDYRRIPGADVRDTHDLLSYTVPSWSSWLNGASLTRLSRETADATIVDVARRINEQGRNAKWHTGPETRPTDFASRLEAAGFTASDLDIPGMTLELDGYVGPQRPVELILERVGVEKQLVHWLEAFDLSFTGEVLGDQHPWLVPFRHLVLARESPYALFVGRVEGEAVACSMAFLGGGAVGLYAIGTVPRHRGRGFGTALTHAAIEFGGRAGMGLAILHASELGEPVYRRIGFQSVCRVSQWIKSAPTPSLT